MEDNWNQIKIKQQLTKFTVNEYNLLQRKWLQKTDWFVKIENVLYICL